MAYEQFLVLLKITQTCEAAYETRQPLISQSRCCRVRRSLGAINFSVPYRSELETLLRRERESCTTTFGNCAFESALPKSSLEFGKLAFHR